MRYDGGTVFMMRPGPSFYRPHEKPHCMFHSLARSIECVHSTGWLTALVLLVLNLGRRASTCVTPCKDGRPAAGLRFRRAVGRLWWEKGAADDGVETWTFACGLGGSMD